MNQVVKEKWLTALASDEYRHGKSQLKIVFSDDWDEDGNPIGDLRVEHCCLGVLCELAILEGIIEEVPETDESDFRAGLYLPEAVEDWAGLPYKDQEALAEKNDERDTTSYAPVIEMIKAL